jgi:hypothetical protein
VSLILALAVRDGRLARNPAVGVPLPRTVRGEQVFLTHEQVDQLAEAAGRDRLAILFLGVKHPWKHHSRPTAHGKASMQVRGY